MVRNTHKVGIAWSWLAALGVTLVLPFFVTGTAVAATPLKGSWENNSSILLDDGFHYINRSGDNSNSYVRNQDGVVAGKDGTVCIKSGSHTVQPDEVGFYGWATYKSNYGVTFHIIRDFNKNDNPPVNSTSAKYHEITRGIWDENDVFIPIANTRSSGSLPAGYTAGCRETAVARDVVLTLITNSNDKYAWNYKEQIDSTDGGKAWVRDAATGRFVWLADPNKGGCKEYIVPSADGKTGLRYHEGAKSLGDTCSWGTYPESINIGNVGNKDNPTKAETSPANSTDPASGSGSGSPDASKPSCDAGVLGWILCPVIRMVVKAYQTLEGWVVGFLKTDALTKENYPNVQEIWANVRNVANAAFVIIFLVIIFSNTLSFGIDNYSFKKMLPRLIAAAIFVQFSWLIMSLMFDLSNILGGGVKDLIFSSLGKNVATGGGLSSADKIFDVSLGLLVGGAAFALGFLVPLLLAVLAALLGVIAVFVTLTLRKFVLVALVVVSPLAFVAWVLPNTESYFKKWWQMLVRLLLMYPIIVAMFAIAEVASKLNLGGQTNNQVPGVSGLFAAILPILDFYQVPKVYKWAGGGMAAIGGWVSGRAKKAGASARNSQMAKDAAAARKERGMRRYGDNLDQSGPKAFGKRIAGRISSGNAFALGTMGQRRMKAGYAAALDTGSKAAAEQLRGMNKEDIEKIAGGQNAGGMKADTAAKYAAMQHMIGISDWEGLRALQDKDPTNPLLARALSANYKAVQEKAPDLNSSATFDKGPEEGKLKSRDDRMLESLKAMGEEEFAALHPDTHAMIANSDVLKLEARDLATRVQKEPVLGRRLKQTSKDHISEITGRKDWPLKDGRTGGDTDASGRPRAREATPYAAPITDMPGGPTDSSATGGDADASGRPEAPKTPTYAPPMTDTPTFDPGSDYSAATEPAPTTAPIVSSSFLAAATGTDGKTDLSAAFSAHDAYESNPDYKYSVNTDIGAGAPVTLPATPPVPMNVPKEASEYIMAKSGGDIGLAKLAHRAYESNPTYATMIDADILIPGRALPNPPPALSAPPPAADPTTPPSDPPTPTP